MSLSIYTRLLRRYNPKTSLEARREFLKLSLAAGAALLISSGCDSQTPTNSAPLAYNTGPTPMLPPLNPTAPAPLTPGPRRNYVKRVVVIGAGFAGLAAAFELLVAGYDVLVLEARPRVSGRVLSLSDFIPNKIIEAGGELIGSNHPVWLSYAKRFNLQMQDVTDYDDDPNLHSPIVLDGQTLSDIQCKGLKDNMDMALKGRMTIDAAPIDENEPWLSPSANGLDNLSTQEWLLGLNVPPLTKTAITAQLEGNNAVALTRQSYLGNLAQVKGGGLERYWDESEVYRCKGGNQQLAQSLAAAIGPDRIRLSTTVTAFDTLNPNQITITCADGQTFLTDDIILAIPPSTWSKIKFTPDFPKGNVPQMGVALKYLANVKSRFWKQESLSPEALTDLPLNVTWEATDAQGPDSDPACLTSFAGGPAALRAKNFAAIERDNLYSAEFEKVFPHYRDNFVKSRFVDWPSDPLTNAGYSFPAPGEIVNVGPFLLSGFGHVHFAGEHTCYKFIGYMEGALTSGVNAARKLAIRDGVLAAPPTPTVTPRPYQPPPVNQLQLNPQPGPQPIQPQPLQPQPIPQPLPPPVSQPAPELIH